MWLLERKLVTSIPTNPTWRSWPPFCCRPVFAMFPSSSSSSFACQGLVHRLHPSLTLPYGEVIKATDAWFALHDSSPLEKEIRSAWDDLACTVSLTALLSTPSLWNRSRVLTAQKSHTAAWLEAFPFASIGNLLSHDELRIAIALWTGAKMSVVILLMI